MSTPCRFGDGGVFVAMRPIRFVVLSLIGVALALPSVAGWAPSNSEDQDPREVCMYVDYVTAASTLQLYPYLDKDSFGFVLRENVHDGFYAMVLVNPPHCDADPLVGPMSALAQTTVWTISHTPDLPPVNGLP